MVSRREWYERTNAIWPANIREIVPTDVEAIRGARRLYRFVTGRTFPAKNVRLTSGNRSTDIRRGIMYVNPRGADRDPHRGWEALVHDLSHRVGVVLHGKEHARAEARMIREVVRRGWLDGALLDKPKAEPAAADPRAVKRARTVEAIARWEKKSKRADNALRKLRRSLAAQDRAAARPAKVREPKAPVERKPRQSVKQQAESLAKLHGIKCERDEGIESRAIWVSDPKIEDTDADPFEGDHYVYEWREALARVQRYVEARGAQS